MTKITHQGVEYTITHHGLVSEAYQRCNERVHGHRIASDLPPEDETALCDAWLDAFASPRKTINKFYGSYYLKHAVERWSGVYVCNGAFIEAVARKGWAVIPEDPISPNAHFKLSFAKDALRYGA